MEDLTKTMDDRDEWQEGVREIQASRVVIQRNSLSVDDNIYITDSQVLENVFNSKCMVGELD